MNSKITSQFPDSIEKRREYGRRRHVVEGANPSQLATMGMRASHCVRSEAIFYMRLSRKRYKKRYIPFGSMPNKVHCAHILVKTESEVKKILERLSKGEKFANIAKEVSTCPSGKRGGDLGTFGRGQMVKEFETAAFALQKGQISAIVKTKHGYHIIKRLE